MKWIYDLKKIFIDKKNLELQSERYKDFFSSSKYIKIFSLKETVISNELYNSSQSNFHENLNLYSKIHKHIFNKSFSILKSFDNHLQKISSIKRKENPFLYSFKINFSNFKKGYINLDFYPNIFLTNEQIKSFNELFINEFFLISHLFFTDNLIFTEGEKHINKYSHLSEEEAVESAYNKMVYLLNIFLEENKKQDIYNKYSEFKRKQSYY